LFSDILDFLDIPILDSGVVRPALLAPGHIVMDTQSLHRLELQSSAGAPLDQTGKVNTAPCVAFETQV
jgi:hypothetical protein